MSENITPTRLVPVTQWPTEHPWPSVAGLRHLIHFEKDNGFDTVVRRIGRRVLIDEAAFFQWADNYSAPKQTRRQKAA
jgi:hypothetical protein